MATRHKRRWIGIGGATAAVAIAVWAAVALATPTGLAITPAVTHLPAHLTWAEGAGDVTGYDVQRVAGACAGATGFLTVDSTAPGVTTLDNTPPGQGTFCYQVVGHYPGGDETSGTAAVTYDTVAPTVTIAQPTATFVGGTVPISVSASDGTPVVTTSPATTISPTSWSTLGVIPDGPYTINASAQDAAGNVGSATPRAVTVDNTAPGPFAANGPGTVAGGPSIFWTSAFDPSGVQYQIQRNPGGLVGALGALSGWTDPTSPAPGTYTYTVQAVDALQHVTSAPAITVVVTKPSDSAPQNVAAASPTNTTPHLSWQRPITFAVTGWQVYRDNALVTTLADAATLSFDDVGVPGQGLHSYVIRAMSGGSLGDASAPVSVVYDTVPPTITTPAATANPDGSVSISWTPAVDPSPGAGLSGYVVRRGSQTTPPGTTTTGADVCTVTTTATGCIDATAQNGSLYGYSVFAIDGAGNVTHDSASVRAVDSVAPGAVTGFRASMGPTNAHLFWDAPDRQGKNADIGSYRILKLAPGTTQPTNPKDGTQVCPGIGFKASDCFVQNLTTGKKVTFAIYALDEVPNYSAATMITVTPNATDHKKPGVPRKVHLKRVGARITMTWLSPKDPDLSHFRVTLYNKGPAPRPSKGKAVVTGRVLKTSFTLKAGQVVYVSLFAIDLSGNFSRVHRLIVMPDKLVVPKSKHKKAAKQKAGSTAPKKPKKS